MKDTILTKEEFKALPRYVRLRDTEMRLINEPVYHGWVYKPSRFIYYREAGCWEVDFELRQGKLFSKSPMKHINGVELVAITREEYMKGNRGYTDGRKVL